MVLLQPIIEICVGPVHHLTPYRLTDRTWVGIMPIRRDTLWTIANDVEVQPLDIVDNSAGLCERISGWFSSLGSPDRPPQLGVRLPPSSSADTFIDFLAT